jgi:hypothetical protein
MFLFCACANQVAATADSAVDSNPTMETEFEILQTPYSKPVLDNPWQVAFDTVYANGFSLHNVELLVDNAWAINGLATLPYDAGIVVFVVPSPMVPKITNLANDEIRPFLIQNTQIFYSDDIIHSSADESNSDNTKRQETVQFAVVSSSHNFTGTMNTSQMHLSVRVAENSKANTDTHLAVVKIVLHRFNFTSPYHDLIMGVAFLHTTTAILDSIHVGTARIFDPSNDRLTSSVSAVTEHNSHFVQNYAFQLLQVRPGENYLNLKFVLQDSYHLPIIQKSSSKFFVASSASASDTLWSNLCDSKVQHNTDVELLKTCSALSTNNSLKVCELVSMSPIASTTESEPITVPIGYNLMLPIPFMQNTALDTDWLFLHLSLHATRKDMTHTTSTDETPQKEYMDWNLKIPFKQSLTACTNEILVEKKGPDVIPVVELTLFKGITLTPLAQDPSAAIVPDDKDNMNALPIADIRAISILENLQTLALIGADSVFSLAGGGMLAFVDVTLIHVRDNNLYDKIQRLMHLGLAYSVENQRLIISPEVLELCSDQLFCHLDPVLQDGYAPNYEDPIVTKQVSTDSKHNSRIHSVRSLSSVNDNDIEWVNNFIGDKTADPTIATIFLNKIQKTLQPNSRWRRVHLLDTRYDWPTLQNNQIHRLITLVSYKTY